MPFAQKVKKSWIAEKFVQKALMVLDFESGANANRIGNVVVVRITAGVDTGETESGIFNLVRQPVPLKVLILSAVERHTVSALLHGLPLLHTQAFALTVVVLTENLFLGRQTEQVTVVKRGIIALSSAEKRFRISPFSFLRRLLSS